LVGVIVVVGEELTVGERVGNAPLPLLVWTFPDLPSKT
jgi:hypothetical protein